MGQVKGYDTNEEANQVALRRATISRKGTRDLLDVSVANDGSGEYAIRVDDYTTANVTYVGKAAIASATSAGVWQVMKVDESTGTVITWADGDSSFDNIWDNRASLSYS